MPTTRKKIIKTVYNEENSDEEEGKDFSDSGSEAIISDLSSSDDDFVSESSSPEEEFGADESFNQSKRKNPTKKSKTVRPFKRNCLLDVSENQPAFSIKDLTEADKLLPPILNLSESDSSDDESPHSFNRSNFTSFQLTDQDNESDNENAGEYRNVFKNTEAVQDDSEEIAKKTFMELEQHKSKIEETKATLQNYSLKPVEQESDVRDLLALGEEDLGMSDVASVSKKSKSKRRRDDSDSDMEDWEEVKDTKSVPQQGIQLIVEFPDAGRRKPKKIDVEMMMKRKINRVKKEYQVYMHKVHVLCWLGHGNYVSNVLNDRSLMAAALSFVPSKEYRPKSKVDITYLEEIITCYKDHITLKPDKSEEKFKPKAPPLKNILLDLIKKKIVGSKKYLILIFVILLRALGLQCRVMYNFVTVPIRPPATELCSLSTKQNNKKASTSKQNLTVEEPKLDESKPTLSPDVTNKTKTRSNNKRSTSRKQKIAQVDGNYDTSSDDEVSEFSFNIKPNEIFENIMQVDGGDDSSSTRRTRSKKRAIADTNESVKDENISPPKKNKRNISRTTSKQIVTGDETKSPAVKGKKVKKETDNENNKSMAPKQNDNNNLKELTNITSGKIINMNSPSTTVVRKSLRRTTLQTGTNKTTTKVVVKNANNDEILAESVSSLKITRKSPRRRNSPKALVENNRTEVVNNKSPRRGKTVNLEVSPNKVSTKESSEHASELSDENMSPAKKPRNSRLSLKRNTPDGNKGKTTNKKLQLRKNNKTEENDEITKLNISNSDNILSTSKTSTRSQKTKVDNNNIDEEQKSNKNAQKKVTSNPKINTKSSSNLKIPQIVLTRGEVENSSQSRVTRKRSRPTNATSEEKHSSKDNNTSIEKSKTTPKRTSRAVKSNISAEDVSQNSSKISVKEELLQETSRIENKKKTRSKKESMKANKDDNNMKLQTRKKSVKGNVKLETDQDVDYLPVDESKQNQSDSDDSFKPPKITPKRKTSNRRVESSKETGSDKKNKLDIWCEVFVEETQEWISVDIVSGKVKSTKEIYANTTQPVCYIVGWDNNNNLKDLTRKYVPHFNTETRKLRVDVLWWNKAVNDYLGLKTKRDKMEDEYLDKMQLEAPLPTVIGEYKNHPLYVLKRHLLKFEAIYPPDATVLGFVRGEPVYARECVYTCRSRNIWYKKHAKVVRLGEKAYKMVKAQPRWDKINRKIITDDPPMEIFGPWQVEDFVPPVAENGIVPRNEYGNVELFKECMLPKGTVHLKLPGLNRIAKKLNIDCATAITGFEVNHGWVRPVYEGFVVCKEFEDIITEAWADDQEEQERKEIERTEIRVYGNWKKLIKGLLIRERLKNKYGFNETATGGKGKAKTKKRK